MLLLVSFINYTHYLVDVSDENCEIIKKYITVEYKCCELQTNQSDNRIEDKTHLIV